MSYIKTVCVRLDEKTNNEIVSLQEGYFKKFGVKISQSDLIRLLISEKHSTASGSNKFDIEIYRSISNK